MIKKITPTKIIQWQQLQGFVEEEEQKAKSKSKPKRKASQRRNMDLYAKSPQQKMQEAAAEQDFQDALQAEKDRQ